MGTLPSDILRVLRVFEDAFSERVWAWAQVLVGGAIRAPGQRTVAAALRVLGLRTPADFQNYHRVLNRARWSSRDLSRRLLLLLVGTFVPAGAPIVVGLDETIERRRGAQIAATGIYRDPVRSRKGHCVQASGLRWVSMQVLAPIPWAQRVWALPFRTGLAPSERYAQERGMQHTTLPDWGRQMTRQLRRWQLEVTFHAVRAHLGVETQRQWSDRAILRTTPALLGLFSVVTLCAHELLHGDHFPARQAAWYAKPLPTFVDALALVRRQLWPVPVDYSLSPAPTDTVHIPRALWNRVTDTLAFAA